jgi:UDP-N-acetyl-D-glucosamine dehydrogenase
MRVIEPAQAPDHLAQLKQRIITRSAHVGVIGIGFIGLPLAVEQAKAGFQVVGVDHDHIRVAQLNNGLNYLRDVIDADLAAAVAGGKLSATTDFGAIRDFDVIIICVPTPVTSNKDPDTTYIRKIGELIAKQLRPGTLITLESTTYPGLTEDVLRPIFDASGLRAGEEYFLAFSPVRSDPGNTDFRAFNINKIVGALTPACLDVATTFYKQTIADVVAVSSPKVAEITKVFENTFRAVNIALVNELALLCDKLGINVWEVIDAAATKPYGIMRFDPGPGVGGHWIPLDPFYLAWSARQHDFHLRFSELAAEINILMPQFVREKVIRQLNLHAKPMLNAEILLIGMAYKKNVDDWQESPALKCLHLFESDHAVVNYHDPRVPSFRDRNGTLRHSVPLTPEVLSSADCVVIMTDHAETDWDFIVHHAQAVLDTRNATKHVKQDRERIVLL